MLKLVKLRWIGEYGNLFLLDISDLLLGMNITKEI
jgi:hypothetical protein